MASVCVLGFISLSPTCVDREKGAILVKALCGVVIAPCARCVDEHETCRIGCSAEEGL